MSLKELETFSKDLEELAEYSPLAKEWLTIEDGIYDVKTIDTFEDYIEYFKPTGECGCVKSDGCFKFGLQCDRYIWIEGFVTLDEYDIEDETYYEVSGKSILILAQDKHYKSEPFHGKLIIRVGEEN